MALNGFRPLNKEFENMERNLLKDNWSEMRYQISEWWEELTDEELDTIDGNQEQLIHALQERYGYTRNLAFLEVKIRMASFHPEGEKREKRLARGVRTLQYPGYETDGPEINNHQNFSGGKSKVRDYGSFVQSK